MNIGFDYDIPDHNTALLPDACLSLYSLNTQRALRSLPKGQSTGGYALRSLPVGLRNFGVKTSEALKTSEVWNIAPKVFETIPVTVQNRPSVV